MNHYRDHNPSFDALQKIHDTMGLSPAMLDLIEQEARMARLMEPSLRAAGLLGPNCDAVRALAGIQPARAMIDLGMQLERISMMAGPANHLSILDEAVIQEVERLGGPARLTEELVAPAFRALANMVPSLQETDFLNDQISLVNLANDVLHTPSIVELRRLQATLEAFPIVPPSDFMAPPVESHKEDLDSQGTASETTDKDPHLATRAVARLKALTTAALQLAEAIAACDDEAEWAELEIQQRAVMARLETLFGFARRNQEDLENGDL